MASSANALQSASQSVYYIPISRSCKATCQTKYTELYRSKDVRLHTLAIALQLHPGARFEMAQTGIGQRKLERFDLKNRRRIKEKQGEEEAEAPCWAGVPENEGNKKN